MLALTPLRSKDERKGTDNHQYHHELGAGESNFSMGIVVDDDFSNNSNNNLLDDINFDDLFVGMDYGDHVLPDLEIDPEMLIEFSVNCGDEESDHQFNNNLSSISNEDKKFLVEEEDDKNNSNRRRSSSSSSSEEEEEEVDRGSAGSAGSCLSSKEDELIMMSKRDDESSCIKLNKDNSSRSTNRKSSSSASQSKGLQGKRKVKVDWTPELHRRFVQAVEQLGMDKAVPSRILEIMGIDCLTRHNIASHLQKYRSHQKHLLAREAEAASWSQRRQIYGGNNNKRSENHRHHHHHHLTNNPWIAPTMGFPPPTPTNNLIQYPFRPLHVWGHPTVDPSSMHMWPKHLLHHHHSPSPPPPPQPPSHHPRWPPLLTSPSPDPSQLWHAHPPNHHQLVTNNALTPGTPYQQQQQLGITRSLLSPPVVQGIPPPPPPPHATMYKVDHRIGGLPTPPNDTHCPPFDHLLHPIKEKVDAAIGDVLTKPWLPLPLGLKPPSLDSVLVELQRQGIPKIPPITTTTTTTTTTAAASSAGA